jgi:hypothetical protein
LPRNSDIIYFISINHVNKLNKKEVFEVYKIVQNHLKQFEISFNQFDEILEGNFFFKVCQKKKSKLNFCFLKSLKTVKK